MIEIQVNSQPVLDAFNRLIAVGQNPHALLGAIGKEMESRVSARFETKTDPTGAPWAPWKPSTVKSYPKSGANNKLLDRFNDMLGSLNHQADNDSVRIGFGQPYAQYHEFGTSKMARRGLLTADPVAGLLGAGDEQAITGILRSALENAIQG